MFDRIKKMYFALLAFGLLLVCFAGISFKNETYLRHVPKEVQLVEGYEVRYENDVLTLTDTLPDSFYGEIAIAFTTFHQNIKVYVGKDLYYEFKMGDSLFGSSPGYAWHFVEVDSVDKGKQIKIEITSPYDATDQVEPIIYMGEKSDIVNMQIKRDAFPLTICAVIILIGIGMVAYWNIIRVNAGIDDRLLYLGMFALTLGIWSMNELSVMTFVWGNRQIGQYLAYCTLTMLALPFVLFIRCLFHNPEAKVWSFLCWLCLGNNVLCVFLHITGIAEFRQTNVLTHITYLTFALITCYMVVREIRMGKISKEMKINIILILIDLAGLFLDIFVYYIGVIDSNVFGRISFLIYIVVLGFLSSKDVSNLVKVGREAEIYQKLAFVDIMTQVSNRTAYVRALEEIEGNQLKNLQVFMFDLNNLKWCNDNIGHACGDAYIGQAAEMIDRLFRGKGTCYRIGGDEFCVIAKNLSDAESDAIIATMMESAEKELKFADGQFQGQIAVGRAKYQDGDLSVDDLLKRADHQMYKKKKELKKGKNKKGKNVKGKEEEKK